MRITETVFDKEKVSIYFDGSISLLDTHTDEGNVVIITDENIYNIYRNQLEAYKIIQIPAGEKSKTQNTIDSIIEQLLKLDADKTTLIAGLGGGVVTDIAGYVSSIYKRGTKLALIPTSILAMTDAAIGGKNGINVGPYKNMVGTTKQPSFLIYDYNFLQTLPKQEWISGFAEIIKHSSIKDEMLFATLEANSLEQYMQNISLTADLIEKNVAIKTSIVIDDVYEKGDRYLLNFGHTFGHAIENLYGIPHGYAVSLGMVIAAKISAEINNFDIVSVERLKNILLKYHLPVSMELNNMQLLTLLKKDKKRAGNKINFVMLSKIGEAIVKQISFKEIEYLQNQLL